MFRSLGTRRTTLVASLLLFATVTLNRNTVKKSSGTKDAVFDSTTTETCGWWILAGDSNTREIENMILKDLQQRRNLTSFTDATYTAKVANSQWRENKGNICDDPRWNDTERVMTFEDRCVIVTRHFIMDNAEIKRVAEGPDHNTAPCGSYFNRSLYQSKFPKIPSLIWFSHGLWGMGKVANFNSSCEAYFSAYTPAFRDLRDRSKMIMWQSNFNINSHPSITNEALDWDIECQRNTSFKHSIPMFDLAAYVRPRLPSSVSDYHITESVQKHVARMIIVLAEYFDFQGQRVWKCICGVFQEAHWSLHNVGPYPVACFHGA